MLAAAAETRKVTSAATSSGSVIRGDAIPNCSGMASRNSSCPSPWAAATRAPTPFGPRQSAGPRRTAGARPPRRPDVAAARPPPHRQSAPAMIRAVRRARFYNSASAPEQAHAHSSCHEDPYDASPEELEEKPGREDARSIVAAATQRQGRGRPRMIAVTDASDTVGNRIVARLRYLGHDVRALIGPGRPLIGPGRLCRRRMNRVWRFAGNHRGDRAEHAVT